MKLHPLSAKAKELMLELGAEGCVLLLVVPNAAGDSWEVEYGAAIDMNNGASWEMMKEAMLLGAEEACSVPSTPQDKPS